MSFYLRDGSAGSSYELLGTSPCLLVRQYSDGSDREITWSGQEECERLSISRVIDQLPLVADKREDENSDEEEEQDGPGARARLIEQEDFVLAYVTISLETARAIFLPGDNSCRSFCVFGTTHKGPYVMLYAPSVRRWLEAYPSYVDCRIDEEQSLFATWKSDVRPDKQCIQVVRATSYNLVSARTVAWSNVFLLIDLDDVREDQDRTPRLRYSSMTEDLRFLLSTQNLVHREDVELTFGVLAQVLEGDAYSMQNDQELKRLRGDIEAQDICRVRPTEARRMKAILGPAFGPPMVGKLFFVVYRNAEGGESVRVGTPLVLLMLRCLGWLRIVDRQRNFKVGPESMEVNLLAEGVTKPVLDMVLELLLLGCMEKKNLKIWRKLRLSQSDGETFRLVAYLCQLWEVEGFDRYVRMYVLQNCVHTLNDDPDGRALNELMGILDRSLIALGGRPIIEEPRVTELDPLVPYILHGLQEGLISGDPPARPNKRQKTSSCLETSDVSSTAVDVRRGDEGKSPI